jgi:hypothetical protein
MWKQRRHGWSRFLEGLSILVLTAGLVAGLGIIGWQALTWLESAVWKPVTVLMTLKWLGIASSFTPTGWYKTLDFVPLSITLPIIGIAIGYMLWSLADHLRKGPKGVL